MHCKALGAELDQNKAFVFMEKKVRECAAHAEELIEDKCVRVTL